MAKKKQVTVKLMVASIMSLGIGLVALVLVVASHYVYRFFKGLRNAF